LRLYRASHSGGPLFPVRGVVFDAVNGLLRQLR
jgi:hypothetical protein